MTAKKTKQTPTRKGQRASGTNPRATGPAQEPERRDSGQPGGGRGRVDVTGTMPEDVRVDPDITEGHPGYQESGESEIIPNERLVKDKTNGEKGSAN